MTPAMTPSMTPAVVQIEGKEYVLIPRVDYLRLVGELSAADARGAQTAAQHAEVAGAVRSARALAGLSQKQLATALGVTQPMVSAIESGRTHASGRYLARVLEVCKLPAK